MKHNQVKKYFPIYDWLRYHWKRSRQFPRKQKKEMRKKTVEMLRKEIEFDEEVGIPFDFTVWWE